MTGHPSYVSVIDPISPAIERVRTVLFRPFDLGRWFVIGFCAWLAQLGQKGGGGGSGGGGGGGGGRGMPQGFEEVRHEIGHAWEEAHYYVVNNLDWILPLGILLVAIVIALVLLVVWLSSRGRFMFLHCVAQNCAEVVNPWRRFRQHGNSLFFFRIVVGLLTFLLGAGFLVLTVIVVIAAANTLGFNLLSIAGIAGSVILAIAIFVLSWATLKLTNDFVVPIMYLRTASITQAWGMLLDMLALNKGRFALYLLFRIVIDLAIGALVLVFACATCCACCLLMIPYINTVILLPVYVFGRSYSLCYLAQYGAEFDVFPPQPEASLDAG